MFFKLLFNFWYRCLLDCLEMNKHLRISRNWYLYWSIIVIFHRWKLVLVMTILIMKNISNIWHNIFMVGIANTWDHNYVILHYISIDGQIYLKCKPYKYMHYNWNINHIGWHFHSWYIVNTILFWDSHYMPSVE